MPDASNDHAVVDLGSNSFRMVVFTARDGWWKRTDEIYEPVRIGEGLAATGRLGKKPMERALATIDVFEHFAEAAGLRRAQLDAVATSAIRDAENAGSFLDRAREQTRLPIRVLSREEEAHYGYLAAVNSTTLADGCVLDLGGGSLQLVRVAGRLPEDSASWRLGAVRMTERFLADDDGGGKTARKGAEKLRAHAIRKLEAAPWLGQGDRRLIGIGGTVRNLAAAAQKAEGGPSLGVQGQVVSATALDELIARLAELPPAERAKVRGVKPARADLILAGAMVVRAVLEAGGFEAIEATEAGLREGVFFERLLDDPGRETPPLFDDVRRASVANLSAQYPVHLRHVDHVAKLALSLFDGLAAAGLHPGDPVERELLWAASMLHDVGMSIDYDDHHKHSKYLILSAGLPGFSPREVALIAQAARYHRKGMPEPGDLEPVLTGKGDLARLDRLSVLLRLAEDLERSRDQQVRETATEVHDGTVRLELHARGRATVPRWAASRETELFRRAFGKDLAVS